MFSDSENHFSVSLGFLISCGCHWEMTVLPTAVASMYPVHIYLTVQGIKTKPCRDLLLVVILATSDDCIFEVAFLKSPVSYDLAPLKSWLTDRDHTELELSELQWNERWK